WTLDRETAVTRLRGARVLGEAIPDSGTEGRGSTYGVERGAVATARAEPLAQLLCNGTLSVEDVINRPELADLSRETVESACIEVRYEGYIRRQLREVERAARYELLHLADSLWDDPLAELSREVHENLEKHAQSKDATHNNVISGILAV